jgi:hypothetical protein
VPDEQAKTFDDDLLVTIDDTDIAPKPVKAARCCGVLLVVVLRTEQLGECCLSQSRLVLRPVLASEIKLLGNNARDIDGELDFGILAVAYLECQRVVSKKLEFRLKAPHSQCLNLHLLPHCDTQVSQ